MSGFGDDSLRELRCVASQQLSNVAGNTMSQNLEEFASTVRESSAVDVNQAVTLAASQSVPPLVPSSEIVTEDNLQFPAISIPASAAVRNVTDNVSVKSEAEDEVCDPLKSANSCSTSQTLGLGTAVTRETVDVKRSIEVPVPCNHKATSHQTVERPKVFFFLSRFHVAYNRSIVVSYVV